MTIEVQTVFIRHKPTDTIVWADYVRDIDEWVRPTLTKDTDCLPYDEQCLFEKTYTYSGQNEAKWLHQLDNETFEAGLGLKPYPTKHIITTIRLF